MEQESTRHTTEIDITTKPADYLKCILKECPLCDHCLRYLAGLQQSSEIAYIGVLNPNYPDAATERCQMFRDSQKVIMKRGLKGFYHDMPRYIEVDIRNELIELFGRYHYFSLRRGDALITPAEQQTIAKICRKHGWEGELKYDATVESWLW